ncbi:MAG: hypothetical protein A2Z20_02750 [Bdellovibrionales bacterium RBG_16_40_8]|nr:MAG: hypothetical protein A2Z20_02750 [Bdellovibrionales bacterium RBG_16_40_8]
MNNVATFSEPDDAFKQFVIISLVLHLTLLIVLTIKNIFVPGEIIELQRSIRVDIVALPDKISQETLPAEIPQSKAPPVNIKPTPEPKKENLKATQKKALEKLQALSAIEKIKKEISESANKPTRSAQEKPQFKGNVISSGSDFTGLSRLRVNEYLETLKAKVREHWILPQWLNNANLKVEIIIVIDSRGYVIKKEIHTPSGNLVFDESCLAAVVDASPFLPPPAEVSENQILVRFPE